MSYDRELVKKIADAMDDPKYQQCRGALGKKREDGTCCFCAEGVVLDVLGVPYKINSYTSAIVFTYKGNTYAGNIPVTLITDYKLPFRSGDLARLNDNGKLTLPQIGQYLRNVYLQ